ncbi:MAG: beta-ketoacyl-ACP synthase II [Bdellovibrionaceae bacterium]|jgi:3-oxoacyl-[acyl-carrier-protein] synthase II|nr:beta-ketoacyl-ACP synthase II [Pseudobdellovibrionaceae bacterium]
MSSRRVVVTGLGMVSPLGLTMQESWQNALKGQSGIGPITLFDASVHSVQFAGEVKNFNAENLIGKKEMKKMDRFIHLCLTATDEAIKDCGLDFTNEELQLNTGSIVGVGMGGMPILEKQRDIMTSRGPGRITPFLIPAIIANMASGHVSIKYGLKGPNYSVTSACASGNHSLGESFNYIKNGMCDVMVSGGTESVVSDLGIGGFAAMKALSTRNETPQKASRPWDQDRDGFVLSEGSSILILEEYEHAKARGAKIYAELKGYGVSSDAHHMTTPSPDGAGASRAMNMCLKSAGANPEDIQYVNAHGTSTPAGDMLETLAIKKSFRNHADKLWVSSTKSMTGHTLGAAGAIESAFSIMSVFDNKVAPTINLENPSEGCDLDYVPNTSREKEITMALNNSFGFGGTNACLIFSKI